MVLKPNKKEKLQFFITLNVCFSLLCLRHFTKEKDLDILQKSPLAFQKKSQQCDKRSSDFSSLQTKEYELTIYKQKDPNLD